MQSDQNVETSEERFARELNARVAFEAMLAASLTAAAVAIPVFWILSLGGAVIDGALLSRLPSILIGGLSLGAAIFLGGFVGAIALGVPLFLLLEKLKLRRGLHYVLGGLLANSIIFIVLSGRAPSPANPAEYLFLLPGVAIAILFLRRIAPIWRAAPFKPPGTPVTFLH